MNQPVLNCTCIVHKDYLFISSLEILIGDSKHQVKVEEKTGTTKDIFLEKTSFVF